MGHQRAKGAASNQSGAGRNLPGTPSRTAGVYVGGVQRRIHEEAGDTDGRGRQRDATGRRHEESGTWSTVEVEPIEITSDSRQSGRRTRRRRRSRGRQESEAEKKKTRITEPTTRTWRVDVVRSGLGRGLVTRPLLAPVVAAFPWARLVFQAPSGCIRSTDVAKLSSRQGEAWFPGPLSTVEMTLLTASTPGQKD